MAINLDSYFGIHAKALTVRDQRASQLANNLANLNTPNYKAQDIDFNALPVSTLALLILPALVVKRAVSAVMAELAISKIAFRVIVILPLVQSSSI